MRSQGLRTSPHYPFFAHLLLSAVRPRSLGYAPRRKSRCLWCPGWSQGFKHQYREDGHRRCEQDVHRTIQIPCCPRTLKTSPQLPGCLRQCGKAKWFDLAILELVLVTVFGLVCLCHAVSAGSCPSPIYPVAMTFNSGINPLFVSVGDFNVDGKPDLAVANSGSTNVSVLLGNGNGTFQAAVNYSAGASPSCVAIGDFNRDGKPDLIVANFG